MTIGIIKRELPQVKKPLTPVVVQQPVNVHAKATSTAYASVSAVGEQLQYIWQKDSGRMGWVNMVGFNTADLVFNGIAEKDAGRYRALISNSGGQTLSAVIEVTVKPLEVSISPILNKPMPEAPPVVIPEKVEEPLEETPLVIEASLKIEAPVEAPVKEAVLKTTTTTTDTKTTTRKTRTVSK